MKKIFVKGFAFVALLAAAQGADAQLVKGNVVAKEMPDMLMNYTPDGDLMNLVSIEIVPDSMTGEFTFDHELPLQAIDATLYVGNDLFGLRLERGKQATIDLKESDKQGYFTAKIGGDNAKVSQFYNAYVRAFDVMKYFAPDPAEAKSNSEYRKILDEEYANLTKQFSLLKNKQEKEYYTHLSEGMYKWQKIRLIMDLAYDEKKELTQYPEYNELVATIDPNDTMNIRTNLVHAWLSSKTPSVNDGDQTDIYMKQMDVIDSEITNQQVKDYLTRSLPYNYFAYGAGDGTNATKFWEKFKVFAKNYPELISKYSEKMKALTEVKAGKEVPYDPTMTRPDGTTCKLADLKGKTVYIDVWATWCVPCCKEIPHLEKVYEQMKDNENVRIISISIDENHNSWQAKLDKDKPQWEQFILSPEEQAHFMNSWGIGGIPRFIILDKDGRIVNADAPRPSNPELVETLKK